MIAILQSTIVGRISDPGQAVIARQATVKRPAQAADFAAFFEGADITLGGRPHIASSWRASRTVHLRHPPNSRCGCIPGVSTWGGEPISIAYHVEPPGHGGGDPPPCLDLSLGRVHHRRLIGQGFDLQASRSDFYGDHRAELKARLLLNPTADQLYTGIPVRR